MRRFNLKVLLILSLGHLVTDIYQGALPAILPFLKENLSLSYTMTGIILMAANFTSSIIQPLFGFLSDKEEKPLLLPIGCLCAGVGLSLLSLPTSYLSVLLLVTLSGLGVASYHPEGYKTAHYFTGERRVAGMAIFSVGGNLGFAIGPILAIWIIHYLGLSSLPLMAIFSILFVGLISLFWRDIALPKPDAATGGGKVPSAEPPQGAYGALGVLMAFVVVRSWMQMGVLSYIPFYYINYLRGDPLYAGKLITTLLLGSAVGTVGIAPLADRWGHKRYLMLSMLAASCLAPFIMAEGWVLFAVLGLLGMLIGSTFSVTVVMAQQLMPKRLGVASGLTVGFAIGAGGICVTLMGVVADHFGVPFALKSIMALPPVGLLLTLALRYPEREKAPL